MLLLSLRFTKYNCYLNFIRIQVLFVFLKMRVFEGTFKIIVFCFVKPVHI